MWHEIFVDSIDALRSLLWQFVDGKVEYWDSVGWRKKDAVLYSRTHCGSFNVMYGCLLRSTEHNSYIGSDKLRQFRPYYFLDHILQSHLAMIGVVWFSKSRSSLVV